MPSTSLITKGKICRIVRIDDRIMKIKLQLKRKKPIKLTI